MDIDTEFDYPSISIGDRNAIKVDVSHGLDDRTLIVVVMLTFIIGACGLVMGLNLSKQARLDDSQREIAARLQVQNNQNSRIEAQLQEIENVRRR